MPYTGPEPVRENAKVAVARRASGDILETQELYANSDSILVEAVIHPT